MDYLSELENRSIYIIREAYNQFENLGALWSVGKDSTTLVWLCMKSFFGRVPFPVIYIDTGHHFREMYEFRDECVERWEQAGLLHAAQDASAQGLHRRTRL